MGLLQCEHCGCWENTACTYVNVKNEPSKYDWTGIEDRMHKKLCCVCMPPKYINGRSTGYGTWHNNFRRVFFPKGSLKTNSVGNLEHIETGDTKIMKYEIKEGDVC